MLKRRMGTYFVVFSCWIIYFGMILKFPEQHRKKPPSDAAPTNRPIEHTNRPIEHHIIPRGLSREQSARYIGISPSLFDHLVKDGRMPKPKRINSRTVWDRRKLDAAFDILDDDSAVCDPWDEILT
jgi:predicted DNA-binding transcriptional regulator AlpA